jgi:tRNA(fMet)-specific endonuclease VapC
MPSYMLDTDIASYIMKRSSQTLLNKLVSLPVSAICISVIVKSELLYGVQVSPRRQRDGAELAAFLRYASVLPLTEKAALHYAEIRADLKMRGEPIGANDLLIAAHARSLDLTLVTNNTREFSRVKGLKLENWTESGA